MLTERDLRKQRRWPQVLVVALLFPAPMASGVMEGFHEFVLDFTKPAEAKKKAKWSPADKLGPDAKGLGWDGPQNASYDVWIETTEPVAVGWSWRTTRSVGIHAEVEPPGKFQFRGSTTVFPSGEVYARYSPDAKHWSSWQSLGAQMPRDKKNPKQTFNFT